MKKGILKIEDAEVGRLGSYKGVIKELPVLSEDQESVYQSIKSNFIEKDVVLLHGVTASGKTEIYIKLIEQQLSKGKQVLFMLPEIALTTQLISRLQYYFGEKIGVYHSKYSVNERVEVWNNVLQNKDKAQIIIGARSSLFLPFNNFLKSSNLGPRGPARRTYILYLLKVKFMQITNSYQYSS